MKSTDGTKDLSIFDNSQDDAILMQIDLLQKIHKELKKQTDLLNAILIK